MKTVLHKCAELSFGKRLLLGAVLFLLLFIFWLIWPVGNPFEVDYSRLVYDAEGNLLRATLSTDQQYRFPVSSEELPAKYVRTLIAWEDKRFENHPGVDIFALVHAVWTNLRAGEIVRGGSTITMQVARLANPKSRTYLNKLRECFIALKYDLHFSKTQILHMYAAHVPMGKNIVGIESASHYYFGKRLTEITWAEAALLVVLPNNPSRVNLSRSRTLLLHKRNRVLQCLMDENILEPLTYNLAVAEPLPTARKRLPFKAPHFTNDVLDAHPRENIVHTTLDYSIHESVKNICDRHYRRLSEEGINNLAVLVAETSTGKIRAYIGSQSFRDTLYQGQVDGVRSHRSTGSLFKPFLVAKVLDRGPYTLKSKIRDVPTFFGTFVPQNASKTFSGLVTLEETLIRSLNVPSVRLLNSYGIRDFYDFLKDAGLQGLFRSPEEYGLPLILGGAEASLWEMTRLYLALANYGEFKSLRSVTFTKNKDEKHPVKQLFSAGAAWLTLEVLNKLSRPGIEFYWHQFNNQIPVAWKTGTSYGQKDGWAIGVNTEWSIGVWTGNFTGEGNAALSGSKSAAPLLFDLFNRLSSNPENTWFEEPEYDLDEVLCCRQSGYPAGPYCPDRIVLKRPIRSYKPGTCPYHRRYILDRKTKKAVCSLCWSESDTMRVTRYILPAAVRDILIHQGYAIDAIPEHDSQCPAFEDNSRLEITYPVDGIRILVPRDLDGMHEKVVFAAKHQRPESQLFWYLNGELIGDTVNHHTLSLDLDSGMYKLTVVDEEGFSRSVSFRAYRTEG